MARPASKTSKFSSASVTVCLRFRFRLARPAPRWSVSARPVRGVLRLVPGTRNPFFQQTCIFCDNHLFPSVSAYLQPFHCVNLRSYRNFITQKENRTHNISTYPHQPPQDSSITTTSHQPDSPKSKQSTVRFPESPP